jgi:hypothetical protein
MSWAQDWSGTAPGTADRFLKASELEGTQRILGKSRKPVLVKP